MASVETLKRIGQGRTAEVYEYDEGTILKLFRSGMHPAIAEDEWKLSSEAHRLGLPTPKLLQRVRVGDRSGIVYERVNGTTMLAKIQAKPWCVYQAARDLADLHARIHRRPVPELPAQKALLARNISAGSHLTDEEKALLLDRLSDLEDGDRMCHGDFHPDNVILDGKGGVWIIDWMTGARGCPAGDAARTALLLSVASVPEGVPFPIKRLIQVLRTGLYAGYLNRYRRLAGVGREEIDAWLLPVAAARLAEGIPDEEKRRLVRLIRSRLTRTQDGDRSVIMKQ